ncbi:MAG: DUF362 domain-containing protein [Verrucomicrobia bacterium]|nr:DUF362 domain-containing protein [Verrucomicrobiota bacterium]MBI3867949.1 DUF362 domain-containing protein [Verrucomicrobiota bacterium]
MRELLSKRTTTIEPLMRAGALVLLLSLAFGASALAALTNDSRVVIIHDPLATDAFRPTLPRVESMVDRGLRAWTGKTTAREAWLSLLSTQDIVGLKVYSAPGLAGSRVEVAEALAKSLLAAGFPPSHVAIWDKLETDLQSSGFTAMGRRLGIRVLSSHEIGYDERIAYTNYYLGRLAWTDKEFGKSGDDVGKRSFFSKIVTKEVTKIINLAPLSNHYRAGVTGCLFSLSMGSVDNTQRFEMSAENLSAAVPEIYAQDPLFDKIILNVVDALLAQYQGESHTYLHYTRPLNELRFSNDPLALDTLSLAELESLRKSYAVATPTNALASIQKLYRDNAPLMELGQSEFSRIRVERR